MNIANISAIIFKKYYKEGVMVFDLKRFRKANKISQQELAEYLGVGQGYISQMERGDRPVPDKTIEKILANQNWTYVEIDTFENHGVMNIPGGEIDSDPVVAALKKEIEMLNAQIESLQATNEKYWEMIQRLTSK